MVRTILKSREVWCRERTVLVNETGYTGLREELLSKELKFFNRWPLPPIEDYLHAWNSSLIGDIIAGVATDRVLLDASPQYLMVPAAAPRVKAAVPHAKFLIVVRVRSRMNTPHKV